MNNLVVILADNHEASIERVLKGLPPSVLSDPDSEVLVIDDDSKDQTFFVSDAAVRRVTRGAKVRVLRNPKTQGPGAGQKLGFRYAIDRGFQRVFVIHGDAESSAGVVERLLAEYWIQPEPDAVFAARSGEAMSFGKRFASGLVTSVRNRLLGCRLLETESRFQSFSTSFLKRIPFERNSDDMGFHAEMVVQTVASGAKLIQVPLSTGASNGFRGSSGVRYAWQNLVACFHFRLQGMGFLYDPKFDVGSIPYGLKESAFSSHSMLVKTIPPKSTVLDIGCGEGWLAKKLVERGCIVDGVDHLPQESVSDSVRRYMRIDLNRHPEDLADRLKRSRYDVILLGDVIEHMTDPEAFLDMIRQAVASRGTSLVVSTGNVAFLVVRLMLSFGQFNYGPKGILDRTHRRLFTIRSFRQMFRQCGYRIRSFQTVPMPFSTVFTGRPGLALLLERVNGWFAKFWPGLFAYQMIVEAEALPTAVQLLALSESRAQSSLHPAPELEPTPLSPN